MSKDYFSILCLPERKWYIDLRNLLSYNNKNVSYFGCPHFVSGWVKVVFHHDEEKSQLVAC